MLGSLASATDRRDLNRRRRPAPSGSVCRLRPLIAAFLPYVRPWKHHEDRIASKPLFAGAQNVSEIHQLANLLLYRLELFFRGQPQFRAVYVIANLGIIECLGRE